MSLTLSKAISQCPKSLFGKKGERPPNYAGIFANVAKAMLSDAGIKFNEATVDSVAEMINPSTFQRQVAQHRAAITGKWNAEEGDYEPVPEKKPKVKSAPKGIDPISGEKITKKAKGKAAKAKPAKKTPAKAPSKPASSPKKSKPTKAKPTAEKPGKAPQKAKAPAKVAKPAAKPAKAKPTPETKSPKLSALAAARAAVAAKKAAATEEVADDDVI